MILNRQRTVRVARPALESFLRRVRRLLGLGKADATVCLVTDAEIAHMNKSFRKKAGPTDVLSFPATPQVAQALLPVPTSTLSRRVPSATKRSPRRRSATKGWRLALNSPKRDANFLGDIAISPTTARRNARKFGRTLSDELRILILHGVLHLLGYDHETDRGQMDCVEQRLRRRLGLA
jgi:probable rRNA maturation factor